MARKDMDIANQRETEINEQTVKQTSFTQKAVQPDGSTLENWYAHFKKLGFVLLKKSAFKLTHTMKGYRKAGCGKSARPV